MAQGEYREIEAIVEDQGELQATNAKLTALIDGMLSLPKMTTETGTVLPQLDPDELAKLPWKTYRTKEDAKPEEAGWIFANANGAEALADLIQKQGKDVPVQISAYKFSVKFSGDQKQFIGRAPIKEAKQKQ